MITLKELRENLDEWSAGQSPHTVHFFDASGNHKGSDSVDGASAAKQHAADLTGSKAGDYSVVIRNHDGKVVTSFGPDDRAPKHIIAAAKKQHSN